jgi:hypothetical protein
LAGWSMKVSSASCPSSSTQTLFSPYSSSKASPITDYFTPDRGIFPSCLKHHL